MIAETFPVGMLACNCTILGDPESGQAIVIDGGDDVASIAARLDHHGLKARYLVHTHAHFDHIGCLGELRERCGGAGLLHYADVPMYKDIARQGSMLGMALKLAPVDLDGELADGDELHAGALTLRAIHTPGHTPGSTSFAISDGDATTIYTGDTLFRGGIGRWDLGGTSMEDIIDSIRTKLLIYPDDTRVVAGHGPMSTIGTERASNPYLAL